MRRFSIVATGLLLAQPGLAQVGSSQSGPPSGRPAGAPAGLNVTIGLAPVLSPAWQGSRDMALSLYPDLRINYGDALFASIPDGLGWNMVNRNGWKAGPLAKIRFGRDEDRGGSPFLITGKSDALEGLGDIDAAVEVGGFVERRVGPLRTRVEVRRGFGGHEGVIADGSIAYQVRAGRAIISAGPRTTVASKDYIRTYFGIDLVQSRRSGLRPYAPSGGVLSYGVGGTVVRPLDKRSALTLFTGVDRLAEEAGNSPLVRDRGRRLQASLGLGYGIRFSL